VHAPGLDEPAGKGAPPGGRSGGPGFAAAPATAPAGAPEHAPLVARGEPFDLPRCGVTGPDQERLEVRPHERLPDSHGHARYVPTRS
jgi:hypothetical protein